MYSSYFFYGPRFILSFSHSPEISMDPINLSRLWYDQLECSREFPKGYAVFTFLTMNTYEILLFVCLLSLCIVLSQVQNSSWKFRSLWQRTVLVPALCHPSCYCSTVHTSLITATTRLRTCSTGLTPDICLRLVFHMSNVIFIHVWWHHPRRLLRILGVHLCTVYSVQCMRVSMHTI